MLIITRKTGEGIHIGDDVVVNVVEAGKDKVTYVKMTPEKVSEVVEKHLKGGSVVSDYVIKG